MQKTGSCKPLVCLSLFAVATLVGCGGPSEDPSEGFSVAPAENVAEIAVQASNAPTTLPGTWPQWRGPDRSGVSRETGLLESWPSDGPPLLWSATDVGKAYSTVAVMSGRLYSMGERDSEEWVFALDAEDGSEIWATKTGGDYDNDYGGGPRSTPTVFDGSVYTLGATGSLSALDAADGSIRWQVDILERFGGANIGWGLSESPLVVGDLLFVATGSADGSIVALDRGDGSVVWQSAGMADAPSYASAIPVGDGDARQLVYVTADALVGIRLLDGTPLWRYTDAANHVANCTTPIYDAGHIFVSSGYDTGGARLTLAAEGPGSSVSEDWVTGDMMNHHGGVVLWDGHLYGFTEHELACVDFETGETRWIDPSIGKGSVTAADGKLYVLAEEGAVALVEATPDEYCEISAFEIPTDGDPAWGHPVIANGRLYLRLRNEIRCYDISG